MKLNRLAGLIGGAVLAMGASSSSAQTPYLTGIEQPQALAPFFERLETADDHLVHIVQIGDSHTAGDLITSSLRARLQARFGRGGRGAIPPGRPYAGYQPRQIDVMESEWSSWTPGPGQGGWPPMGISGTRAMVAAGSAARLDMVADPGAAFTRTVVCGTGVGRVVAEIDGTPHPLDFDGAGVGAACRTVQTSAPASRLTLRAEAGAVEVSSLATFADSGVAVSNLGVIGATQKDLAGRDAAIVRAELQAWSPDLIVLAFGTNEGFDPALDIVAYEGLLRGQIERLRGLAPEASLMILGAPDALSPNGGPMCDAAPDALTRWSPPVMLGLVRDVQRGVAADMGVAFWDWRMAMGGDCSADRLATAAEPLMRGDRVHFNSAGGDWIGKLIFDDLIAAHETWSAGRGEAP